MTWKSTDPRFDINKRATIVIVRPGGSGRISSLARVETKNGWSVFTDFMEGRSFIGPDDDWDEDWLWCYAPPVTKLAKPGTHPEDKKALDILDKAASKVE